MVFQLIESAIRGVRGHQLAKRPFIYRTGILLKKSGGDKWFENE